MTDTKSQNQEAQRPLSQKKKKETKLNKNKQMNNKKTIPRHIIFKLQKTKDKENLNRRPLHF